MLLCSVLSGLDYQFERQTLWKNWHLQSRSSSDAVSSLVRLMISLQTSNVVQCYRIYVRSRLLMCQDSVRCICSCCSQSLSTTPGNVPHLQEGFLGSSIIRGIGSVDTGLLHTFNAYCSHNFVQ